jgi:hypothetical protein
LHDREGITWDIFVERTQGKLSVQEKRQSAGIRLTYAENNTIANEEAGLSVLAFCTLVGVGYLAMMGFLHRHYQHMVWKRFSGNADFVMNHDLQPAMVKIATKMPSATTDGNVQDAEII